MSSNHAQPKGSAFNSVAHTEAALGAGRHYENKNEGHNKMYDNYSDLVEHNHHMTYGESKKESRGHRIDRELAEEDQEEINRKEAARQQKEKHIM
ncbi:hypothetical protein BX666DRAFT_1868868 [Dichotomocladium elegans]|nr:hypothetical protein BX666DRAFT_1868868 [Dichotomocladium elegans]